MKSIKALIIILVLGLSNTACEKVVDLKLKENEAKMTVDGLISPNLEESYVKLEWTKSYFSEQSYLPIENAEVRVSTADGYTITFREVSPGIYLPPNNFVGEIGLRYQLNVNHPEGNLQAQSTMPDTTTIAHMELFKASAEDLKWDEGYHLLGTMINQPNVKNYYLAELYVNGNLNLRTAEDITVFNDEYFGDNPTFSGVIKRWITDEGDELPQLNDTLSIRLLNLDKAAYDYYSALSETPQQGGIFGKNPANLPSNIQGGLGLFQASSYTQSRPIIVAE